jgi:prepilin-type N-terminal cleavage/methylation domain-containing protein
MIAPRRTTCSSARQRRGFTLVELLVTLTIVGIMAAAALFAMTAATDTAKAAKSRATITRLNSLLMQRWQSYRTRRVPLLASTRGRQRNQISKLQLAGLRELMLIELPDRWDDVNYTPQAIQRTALAQAYLRRYLNNINPTTGSPKQPTPRYQGAECLYLIISMATGDGESMEQFSDGDVGDVDQDGALEFIDSWGNPIGFLRWPAGFLSDLQPLAQAVGEVGDTQEDHDPFDPFHRDPQAYRLVPLVYSAGPDEAYGMTAGGEVTFTYGGIPNPYLFVATDPISGEEVRRGAPRVDPDDGTQGWIDNIHNHLIGQK